MKSFRGNLEEFRFFNVIVARRSICDPRFGIVLCASDSRANREKRSIADRAVAGRSPLNQAWRCHRPPLDSSCCREDSMRMSQARFQQKQLQEKEQKLLQLYDQQQQRAYQVVQRGSAGSNGSSHGSTISQHTVTKTSTTSHTTSTSQGGKVRQMFDERRQTTVKGIDRSYPLEPLENKPRKQTNGNAVQRNGNVTVSRQSVTVKRVARADANSNLNGGKPIVSYHEEITRESFGPSERQHTDDDKFGNENHLARYANGDHGDRIHIEEILDEDATQKNRMMAKLHLMEYDETPKHGVKNDLEREEFLEDFIVDAPDKPPKQSVTKKLSQAEVRLERFKNANAKRSNGVAKNISAISVPKKRSDLVFPAKSTSSGNGMMKNRMQNIAEKGSLGGRESPRSDEPEVTSVAYKNVERTPSSSDFEGGRRRSYSPRFFCRESEKSATTYAIDAKNAGRFSPDSSNAVKRSESPKFVCKESEKSATAYAINSKNAGRFSPDFSKVIKKRSESPKLFFKESEKSAHAVDSKQTGRLSPEFSKSIRTRSESPKFFCKESKKSATTYAIDSKQTGRLSPQFSKSIRTRSESPKFFCKESENSATTYAIDSKTSERLSPGFSKSVRKQSESPKYFCKESEKSVTTYATDPKTVRKLSSEFPKDTKHSIKIESERNKRVSAGDNQNIIKIPDRSVTMDINIIDRNVKSFEPGRTSRTTSPEILKRIERKAESKPIKSKSPNFFERLRERSLSPQFFSSKSKKPTTTIPDTKFKSPEPKASCLKILPERQERSSVYINGAKSPESRKKVLITPSTSPQLFSADSDRSSTIILVKPDTIIKSRTESVKSRTKQRTPELTFRKPDATYSNRILDLNKKTSDEELNANSKHNIRNSVSRFFSEQSVRAAKNADTDFAKIGKDSDLSRGSSPVSLKDMDATSHNKKSGKAITKTYVSGGSREPSPKLRERVNKKEGTPEFFCYETDKSATTLSLKPKSTKKITEEWSKSSGSKGKNFVKESSKSPENFSTTKGNKITVNIGKGNYRESFPESQKIVDGRSGTPEFFRYETDRSATSVSRKPRPTQESTTERSKDLRPKLSSSEAIRTRLSKSPDNVILLKNSKASGNFGRKGSRTSSPGSQEIGNNRSGTPEFFRYETDRSATSVSLKPRPTKDSIVETSKNLRSRMHSIKKVPNRLAENPENLFSSTKGHRTTVNNRNSFPKSQKIADDRSGTPEFFRYETDRPATSVSLKPRPTKESTTESCKNLRAKLNSSEIIRTRLSKSPNDINSNKDNKISGNFGRESIRNSSPESQEIGNNRSGTPEFFRYETDRSATTVSLKPKPSKNSIIENSKNSKIMQTRTSTTPENFSPSKSKIIININKGGSRNSSPKSRKIVNSRSRTPECFCYETDKSATTVSLSPKCTKKFDSPKTIKTESRSSKSPDNLISTKNSEISINRGEGSSHDSSPKSQSIVDGRSSTPEFFCYETDRSATTVSLKPRPTKDSSIERFKNPPPKSNSSTNIQFRARSTNSDNFTHGGRSGSRGSSPKSQEIVDSGSPKFFCYETEKSATTVSLELTSSEDSISGSSKSTKSRSVSPTSESKERPLKSPNSFVLSEDVKATRRGSGSILSSTKMIRDITKRQRSKTRSDKLSRKYSRESRRISTASENVEGISSVRGSESKYRLRSDQSRELKVNRDAVKRTTHSPKPYELPRSSPKNSTSAEVDTGTQEIAIPDQYMKQKEPERELRSTYSKSCEASQGFKKKSKTVSSFTYSVRKAGRKRSSFFESSIFDASGKDRRTIDHRATLESSGNASPTRLGDEKDVSLKRVARNASSTERSCSNGPSPTNESIFRTSKRGTGEYFERRETLGSPGRTGSPHSKDAEKRPRPKETVLSESQRRRSKKQTQTLRSIELVRKTMKRESQGTQLKVFREAEVAKEHEVLSCVEGEIEVRKSSSTTTGMTNLANGSGSRGKDYERTDSVESALRRFDSIDTEAGAVSAQSTLERSKESITAKRQTLLGSSRTERAADTSKTISLKALDRRNANSRSPTSESSRATLRESSASESELAESGSRVPKTRESRMKKLAKARDSIELARSFARSKSPTCRRKLFQDDEIESSGSKHESNSVKTLKRLSSVQTDTTNNKSKTGDSAGTASKVRKSASGETSTKDTGEGETDEASTGADRSLSTKQLRSIEDIRKSIESESSDRRAKRASFKSAIANDALRVSSTVRPQSRRMSSVQRGGNRSGTLSRRSGNLSAKSNALGDSEGFVKCASRFSRVAKSPSPDPTKGAETSNRQRRNVPPSPTKNPDTVTRRPSTDSKVQDTKPSKRPMPMRSTEPIGNRKTTTTTTRKSTDVVDGAILENGLHLRNQTAETKYDNDSPTTKKSEAFVIDFDEQPSKENDGPPRRKPLLRRQSTEKHTPHTQSGRPSSSVSYTSNGSAMHGSMTKGKTPTKAKTPVSGTPTTKGSASSKGGGSSCTVDGLLVSCKVCGRRFAQDRVTLHEQICAKTGQKKRKKFDTMMHRVRGTELESFVRKGIGTCKKLNEKAKKPEVKSNWRRKHEDFINAIRSAKQVQAHLAAGGKLSDLPPPPASDTSDYIQCPHCGRKFNQAAAERHIPKCEHMLHNKPVHSRVPPKPRR